MNPTLDRDVAEAIYKIVGDTYETEECFVQAKIDYAPDDGSQELSVSDEWSLFHGRPTTYHIDMSDMKFGMNIDEYGRVLDERLKNLRIIPAPDFSELIRLLPKIGEKKGWEFEEFFGGVTIAKVRIVAYHLANCYLETRTEEEGMKQVSEYLRKIL